MGFEPVCSDPVKLNSMISNCYKKNRFFRSIYAILFAAMLVLSCSDEQDFEGGGRDPGTGEEPVQTGYLPLIEVVTNGAIVDEPKVRSILKITEQGEVTHEGIAGIEIRGASSQMFDKKSYGLETWDSNNEDINVSLLGMPEEEDWVLHGPFSDKSLMRNKLIYDLSNDMGRYASRTKFVELIINGNYKGVYVFMEKLKRNKDRIAIEKLRPDENSGDDLTGGYILKIDKVAGSNVGNGYNNQNSFASEFEPPFTGGGEIRFLYEYPDAREISTQQRDYIKKYVQDFESALASDDFKDPVTGYRAYADVESFVDFFILNEISHNVDGYRLSTFMHKDKNGKLTMGPIWDFNLAFGNADYCGGGNTDTWAYRFNERCPGDFWSVPFWWYRLLEDPDFVVLLKNRWFELRSNVFSNQAVLGRISGYQDEMKEVDAINRNFSKWNILGKWIWPNNFVGTTYDAERIYMEDWIVDRMDWLDSAISQL